jgi:integrase
MRVNELLQMPHDCCDSKERSLYIPKAKNKFSVRKVPIHNRIFDLVKGFYDMIGKSLVVNDGGFAVAYNNFATRDFTRLMKEIGHPELHLHDTRHTFITVGRNYMDKLHLQKIVGHKPDDITDKVYTHIQFSELLTSINQIKKI